MTDPRAHLSPATPPRTVAENIERELACSILRGERLPGSRLPSVRDLAALHEVTIPTVHRALDRLESAGLVTAKRGSGVTVLDPHRSMNLSLIPLWFEALSDQPKKAAKILADFLALRRLIAMHLLETSSHKLLAALPALLPFAIELGTATDLLAIARADAALIRVVVDQADNFALSAVFCTVETVALEVPYMAEALYADRKAHLAVIHQAVASFAKPGRARAAQELETALKQWDERTVQNYVELLARAKRRKRR